MTRAEIRTTARAFSRSRGGLAGNDTEVNLFLDQSLLDFSLVSYGVFYTTEYPINQDPNDDNYRQIDLATGFYRTHSVYYLRGNGNAFGKLEKEDLKDLLDPYYDSVGTGYPTGYAVTPDDDKPVMYFDSVPGAGNVRVHWWGRLQWADSAGDIVATPDDSSVPSMLAEYHIALAHRTAAYIASTNYDHDVATAQEALFEDVAGRYSRVLGHRSGNTGMYVPRLSLFRHPFAVAINRPQVGT